MLGENCNVLKLSETLMPVFVKGRLLNRVAMCRCIVVHSLTLEGHLSLSVVPV